MAEVSLNAAPILNDDKEKYFKKLTISRLLGGFKLSDEDSNLEVNGFGIAIQIILFILFPGITIGISLAFGDKIMAGLISGAVTMVLNLVLQLVIRSKFKKSLDGGDIPGLGLEENQQQLIQIIKPRIKNLEFFVVIFLTFGFNFMFGYHLNDVKDGNIAHLILGIFCGMTTSYSLIVESPKEAFSMIGDNVDFHFYSTLYNRVYYFIICVIIKMIILGEDDENKNTKYIDLVISLLPFLYFFAIIGPIWATIMYAFEKINFWVLGFECSSNDVRTIFWTCLNAGVCGIIYLFINGNMDEGLTVGITSIFALILSENVLFRIGDYYTKAESFKHNTKIPKSNYLCKAAFIIIVGAVGVVFPIIKPEKSLSKLLGLISFIIFALVKLLEYGQSSYAFGLIRSIHMKITQHNLVKFIYQIQQIVGLLAVGGLNYDYLVNKNISEGWSQFVAAMFIFRSFRHLYSDLQMINIILLEIFILDKYLPEYSALLTILNIAVANVLRRGTIWIYQIIKMVKDKKQRINKISLFLVLSFTVLLPMNLAALVGSSLLDTPFVPFLGLPLFVIGFPRPKRMWPHLQPIVQSTGESLLYNKFMQNFQKQLQQIVHRYQFMFTPGKYFLIKIDKYLAMLQILECGREYQVVHVRGAESQDPVSCHNHEATAIDDLAQEAFVKKTSGVFKDYFGSALPVTEFDVDGYQEQTIKMTGVVEQPDFQICFRSVYIRLIVFMMNRYLVKSDGEMLKSLAENISQSLDMNKARENFPQKWVEQIKFDCYQRAEPISFLKVKQIDDGLPLRGHSANSNQQNTSHKPLQQNNNNNDDFFGVVQNTRSPQINQNTQREQVSTQQKLAPNNNNKRDSNDDFLAELGIVGNNNNQDIYAPAPQVTRNQSRHKKPNNEPVFKGPDQIQNNSTQVQQSNVQQSQQKDPLFDDELNEVLNLSNEININSQQQKPEPKKQPEPPKQYDVFNDNQNNNDVEQFLAKELTPQQTKVSKQQKRKRHVNDAFNSQPYDDDLERELAGIGYSDQQTPQQSQPQQQSQYQQQQQQQSKQDKEVVDILEDLDDILAPNPPPPPMFGNDFYNMDKQSDHTRTTDVQAQSPQTGGAFMNHIMALTGFIYAQSSGDFQFTSETVNKVEIYKSYDNQESLKKSRIFNNISQQQKDKIIQIQKFAIRYAMKLSFEQLSIMFDPEYSDEELQENIIDLEKNTYVGMGTDKEWEQASQDNVETLWNLYHSNSDNTLGAYISKLETIQCHLFQFNEDIINGIWANLMFELYYVTNDDDERYSIQTHKNFLRNIIIENSEQPLGYAPFYSGPVVVHV